MKTINLYTDGGARGNPGPAATGVVIMDSRSKVLASKSKYLGRATNNQAEYQALIQGLEEIIKLARKSKVAVKAHLDSELIVKQMNGEYRVKDAGLKPLFTKANKLADAFGSVQFIHVARDKNKKADSLVNQELDKDRG